MVVSEKDALEFSVASARKAEAQLMLDSVAAKRLVLEIAEREATARLRAAERVCSMIRSRNGLPANALISGPGETYPLGTVIDPDACAWDDATIVTTGDRRHSA